MGNFVRDAEAADSAVRRPTENPVSPIVFYAGKETVKINEF